MSELVDGAPHEPPQIPAAPPAPDLAIALSRVLDRGMVTLRCDLQTPALDEALQTLLGCGVPAVRRADEGREGCAAAWMSPDELLLFMPRDKVAQAPTRLNEALAGVHHLALDVTDARAVFSLKGAGAAEVLAKGAPVDFSDSAFRVGDFRRTRLGALAAAIWRREQGYELLCFRSMGDYAERWLRQSARRGSLPGL